MKLTFYPHNILPTYSWFIIKVEQLNMHIYFTEKCIGNYLFIWSIPMSVPNFLWTHMQISYSTVTFGQKADNSVTHYVRSLGV